MTSEGTLQRLDTPELRVAEEIELIEQYLRIHAMARAFGMGLRYYSDQLNALCGAAASLTIGSRTDGTGCAEAARA
jgi:hypothetical protein